MRHGSVFFISLLSGLLFLGCSDTGSGPSNGGGDPDPEGSSPFRVSIAPWPGTAIAAYTLIADDYYLTSQIHADTMMANRGMGMGFGAIVSNIARATWQDARAKIGRGHEIVNHSWDHPCFTDVEECGSGPVVGTEAFPLQLKQSTEVIEQNAGVRPTFMVFPFDCATDTALSYLKNELGYLGARMGQKQKLNENTFDSFRPNFDVNWPVEQKENQRWSLNELIDAVLTQGGGWAIREIHGVDGGWGPVPLAEMREHADYLKSKVDAGLLWVAPPSRVIQYHDQRNHYKPVASVRIDTVMWDGVPVAEEEVFSVSFTGSPLSPLYREPLTLVISDLPDRGNLQWSLRIGVQEPITIEATDEIRVEVRPELGPVELRAVSVP